MIAYRNVALLAAMVLAALVPAHQPGVAQHTDIVVLTDLRPVADRHSPAERFALLEQRVLTTPQSYAALWEAAEAGAVLGAAQDDRDTRMEIVRRARGYAQEAKAANPQGIEGRYWLAVTSGLLADDEGGRTRIRLAEEAWSEATWVLAVDSAHAGAHHLLGRIHAAVMRLNPVTRFLARTLLGGEVLGRASWERAEYHLKSAAELAPGDAVNHLELGMAYRDLGRRDEAVEAFRRAAETPPWRAADRRHIRQALTMLEELSGTDVIRS